MRLREGLIDGEFFVAGKIGLLSLYFDYVDPELDLGWHEFASLRETEAPTTDRAGRDIADIVDHLMALQRNA